MELQQKISMFYFNNKMDAAEFVAGLKKATEEGAPSVLVWTTTTQQGRCAVFFVEGVTESWVGSRLTQIEFFNGSQEVRKEVSP